MPYRDSPNEETTDDELPDVSYRLGRAERLIAGAALAVVGLFGFMAIRAEMAERALRAELLKRHDAVVASLSEAQHSVIPRTDQWTRELGAKAYPGDVVAPEAKAPGALAALLAKPGIYLRIGIDDTANEELIHGAARASVKDSLSMCVLTPDAGALNEGAPEPEWLGPVANLKEVHRGLLALSPGWRKDVAGAGDMLRLVVLREALDTPNQTEIDRAKSITDRAGFFLVAVDELPAGWKASIHESNGKAVQAVPHPVRVGLYDMSTGELLLRMRREVDALTLPVSAGSTDAVRRQVQGCELGMQVRHLADSI
ncbi:MAG: hypothetical protein U0165_18015 [Polyangiaceae bacterium]